MQKAAKKARNNKEKFKEYFRKEALELIEKYPDILNIKGK